MSDISGWALSYPEGRKLEDGRPTYLGTHDDDGLFVSDERLQVARDNWTERRAEDFERDSKRGWVDKTSGREYRQVRGTPFAGLGASGGDEVDLFFVDAGRFVFLSGSEERVAAQHLGRLSGFAAADHAVQQ